MTSTCYRFEEFVGENPLFLNIDATYVIHLEGNGRLDSVKKELTEFYPSKNTFILFNKGFKKCEKDNAKIFRISHAKISPTTLHLFYFLQEIK